jgi:hypothetical protein
MPVHNALPYLDEAIQSILDQSLADFEFVILDDASTDGSSKRLRYWAQKDPRIRLMEVQKNLGPALSSQRVAEAAKAPIVARMDADDISTAERLRQQFELLREHPSAGVVASLCDVIDARGRKIRGPDVWRVVRNSTMVPFPHGAIMYRREAFDSVGGYRGECDYWEDQDLIMRLAAVSMIMVIPRSLYLVRQTATSTRMSAARKRQELAIDSMYRRLSALSGEISPKDLPSAHRKLDPRVFVSLGSTELWAGGRPRLFRRLLRHGRLQMDRPSMAAMLWCLWASASPRTLKGFANTLCKARNLFACHRLNLDGPLYWSPPVRAQCEVESVSAPARVGKEPASAR